MNLYEFAERNNDEMRMLVSKDEDLYRKIFEASKRLVDNSEQIRVTVARIEPPAGDRETPAPKQTSKVTSKSRHAHVCILHSLQGANFLPIHFNPTVIAASVVGSVTKTMNTRRNIVTPAAKSTRRQCRSPHVLDCYRKYRRVLTFQAVLTEGRESLDRYSKHRSELAAWPDRESCQSLQRLAGSVSPSRLPLHTCQTNTTRSESWANWTARLR